MSMSVMSVFYYIYICISIINVFVTRVCVLIPYVIYACHMAMC